MQEQTCSSNSMTSLLHRQKRQAHTETGTQERKALRGRCFAEHRSLSRKETGRGVAFSTSDSYTKSSAFLEVQFCLGRQGCLYPHAFGHLKCVQNFVADPRCFFSALQAVGPRLPFIVAEVRRLRVACNDQ